MAAARRPDGGFMSGDPGNATMSVGSKPRRRVAVVASLTRSLTNFRLQLLQAMVGAGHEVIAFAPERDAEVERTLQTIGVRFVVVPMARTGINPLADLRTLFALWRHFRRLKPDIVLPYTMKPIIYGCLAGRLAGVAHRFALVTGLGYVFGDAEPTARLTLLRQLSIRLYRLALAGVERVFVYNDADAEELRRHRMIGEPSRIVPVPGTGIDLDHFAACDPPMQPVTFLLIARLLRDKGVVQFVEAARQLRARHPEIRAWLLGPFDANPAGISKSDVDGWVAEGAIDYLGETRDVRPFLAQCTVFVLPSFYREGIPRTILEAMATGRAIITTDMPGCRDTVIDGENGYIVRPRDHAGLAGAMEAFVVEPDLALRMGRRSRELARQRFDVHRVNRLLLGSMDLI